MRILQLVVVTAIAVVGGTGATAATITLGSHFLIPNTAGQTVPIYVTDIVPNAGNVAAPGNVNGMVLNVAIDEGGPAYGGTPGYAITAIDVDSGPSIWSAPNSPAGHIEPTTFYDGQFASVSLLLESGFVNVSSGILATLVIDTTGFGPGIHKLSLSGGVVGDQFGDTELVGYGVPTNIVYLYFDGTGGFLGSLDVPEPDSLVLALLAVGAFGAIAMRKR